MSSSADLLQAVLEASWQGSLVIVLILLLRPVLGLRVPARWRALLWSLALLRLLVPAFLLPPSPASLQNLPVVDHPLEHAARAFERTETTAAEIPFATQPHLFPQGPDETSVPPTPAAPRAEATPTSRSWWPLGMAIWLTGATLTAGWILGGTVRLQRRLRRDAGEVDVRILSIWDNCCARAFTQAEPMKAPAKTPGRKEFKGLFTSFASWHLGESQSRPRLAQTSALTSPALVGLWRPTLYLPHTGCEELSKADWEHIFLHELAHFRRRDHWLHALQLLALCAHWFNPLVWLGFRSLRADRELAADEWALRHLATDRPVAYGDTLLKVLTAHTHRGLTPGLVGILEDGAQMKQRLRHIVAFAPRRLAGSLAGVVVLLALAAVVLGRQPTDLKDYEGLAPAESLVIAARRGDQPAVKQLLADGMDINGVASLRGERTALAAAIAGRQMEMIRWLVAKGVGVNLKPDKGETPIVLALRKGHLDLAEYLRNQGATCDAETWAAARGDLPAIETYLADGKPGFDKLKLLGEVAAAHGHRALFARLWDALKQLPEQRDHFPFSRGAFVVAITRGHRGVIEEILARDRNLVPGDGVNRLAAPASRAPGMREWLGEKGIKVPEYTDGERLIDAAECENLPEIRRLLAAGVDVNYRGESDWTPISKAATWGCPRAVKLLLEKGADANTRKHTYTTLSLAKTPEIADLLFAAGADVNATIFNRDVHGITYCINHGSKEMVQWFLDHGVDPTKVKDDEPTLLFSASSPEIVDLLVARGVDIHAKDEEGRTALIWALQMRTAPAKVVTALLKHGADPNVRMRGGYTPLMQAEDGPSVDALVAGGADLQAVDDRGNGVLYTGWGSGVPSRIEALRRHGLKLDPVKGGELLRNAVILQGDVAAVKRLLAMGIDPNAEDFWEGRPTGTALNAAISRGKFKIAEVLRASGANDVGLLSEASAKGDLRRMTALLDGGAGVNDLASNGETPLHFAVQQGQIEAVKLLLARGANVDLFTSTGYTALDLAGTILGSAEHSNYSQISRLKPEEVKSSLKEIIAAIRERKPDPNFRNSAGETALMASAAVGGISGLKSGMDINAHRPDGMTALMIAIATQPKNAPKEGPGSVGTPGKDGKVTQWMSARAHFVKTLLANGADVTLRNNAGQTALDLARENGNEEILGLLEKKP